MVFCFLVFLGFFFICFCFKFPCVKFLLISVLKFYILNCENGTVIEWYIIVHVFIYFVVFILSINFRVLAWSLYSFIKFLILHEIDICISLGMISMYIKNKVLRYTESFIFYKIDKIFLSWKLVNVSSDFYGSSLRPA